MTWDDVRADIEQRLRSILELRPDWNNHLLCSMEHWYVQYVDSGEGLLAEVVGPYWLDAAAPAYTDEQIEVIVESLEFWPAEADVEENFQRRYARDEVEQAAQDAVVVLRDVLSGSPEQVSFEGPGPRDLEALRARFGSAAPTDAPPTTQSDVAQPPAPTSTDPEWRDSLRELSHAPHDRWRKMDPQARARQRLTVAAADTLSLSDWEVELAGCLPGVGPVHLHEELGGYAADMRTWRRAAQDLVHGPDPIRQLKGVLERAAALGRSKVSARYDTLRLLIHLGIVITSEVLLYREPEPEVDYSDITDPEARAFIEYEVAQAAAWEAEWEEEQRAEIPEKHREARSRAVLLDWATAVLEDDLVSARIALDGCPPELKEAGEWSWSLHRTMQTHGMATGDVGLVVASVLEDERDDLRRASERLEEFADEATREGTPRMVEQLRAAAAAALERWVTEQAATGPLTERDAEAWARRGVYSDELMGPLPPIGLEVLGVVGSRDEGEVQLLTCGGGSVRVPLDEPLVEVFKPVLQSGTLIKAYVVLPATEGDDATAEAADGDAALAWIAPVWGWRPSFEVVSVRWGYAKTLRDRLQYVDDLPAIADAREQAARWKSIKSAAETGALIAARHRHPLLETMVDDDASVEGPWIAVEQLAGHLPGRLGWRSVSEAAWGATHSLAASGHLPGRLLATLPRTLPASTLATVTESDLAALAELTADGEDSAGSRWLSHGMRSGLDLRPGLVTSLPAFHAAGARNPVVAAAFAAAGWDAARLVQHGPGYLAIDCQLPWSGPEDTEWVSLSRATLVMDSAGAARLPGLAEAGFSAAQAVRICQERIDDHTAERMRANPDDPEWRRISAGLSSKALAELTSVCGDAERALTHAEACSVTGEEDLKSAWTWARHGIGPAERAAWRAAGFDRPMAERWRPVCGPADAARYKAEGLTLAKVRARLLAAGT